MHEYSEPTRPQRHAALLDIVETQEIRTQDQLVGALRRRGVVATQSSVSRDVRDLGLVKVAGRYRVPGNGTNAEPVVAWRSWVRTARRAGNHIVVLRCDTGCAQPVGLAIDQLSPPGIAGTLAGDDTVFVAVTSAAAGSRLVRSLGLRLEKS